jgi:hypothetical protein
MIVAEIVPAVARRKRIAAPMLRDENVDLTINELLRIRGREQPAGGTQPAGRARATGRTPAIAPARSPARPLRATPRVVAAKARVAPPKARRARRR